MAGDQRDASYLPCDFCGRPKSEVPNRLVSRRAVICSECLGHGTQAIMDHAHKNNVTVEVSIVIKNGDEAR